MTLTGLPPLPPLWSLGAQQSRWGYESADDIRGVIQAYRSRGLPLDAVYLDIDYLDAYKVWTWDRSRFPDPQGLTREAASAGVQLVPIINPNVKAEPGYAPYDEAKERDRSIEQMQRAVDLNPKNAAALNYLGYTYAEMGVRLDEAESLIRRALDIDPDDGFYIDSLGWVYYQRGDYRKAIEQLERAVEIANDDPTVIEHLGDAYERVGDSDDALRAYRDALGRSKETGQSERLRGKIQALELRGKAEGTGL